MPTKLARTALLLAALLCGCAGATFIPFANADSSCTRTTWWIEAPKSITVGEEATLRIRRCQGRATPSAFSWSTSHPMIIGIVSEESDLVVVKASKAGKATITAHSKKPLPPDRSSVFIIVEPGRFGVTEATSAGE